MVHVDARVTSLTATWDGRQFPCEAIGGGAAFEVFSDVEIAGFQRDRRSAARASWHRYVHVTDLTALSGGVAMPTETPLTAPLSRGRGWADIHQAVHSVAHRDDPSIAAIRATATVRRGTMMLKVLPPAQLAGYLGGWQPHGFCYRAYDVAHLRTPQDLAVLRPDDVAEPGAVAFALRWRAVDPLDYQVPSGAVQAGMTGLSPHSRVGAPVLGTGFTPSAQHLIPEFVTAGLTDLPLPVNAQLLGYTPDGDEVVLYAYQPEQRGWLRLAGPSWRHLLADLPGVNPGQDYVPASDEMVSSRLVGWIGDHEHEAVADPPDEFRIRAATRAARYPVQALARRWYAASWRGASCVLLRQQGDWVRVRLAAPDADAVALLPVQCHERGVYEGWAPAADLTDHRTVDVEYPL